MRPDSLSFGNLVGRDATGPTQSLVESVDELTLAEGLVGLGR